MNNPQSYERKNFAVYVLGAGFSIPARLPSAVELWREVRSRASSMKGRAGRFVVDLNAFMEYKKRTTGKELTPDEVDFEEFLGFLDVEFFLGLRGSDTWSAEGNESQVVVKTLIAEILLERTPDKVPDLYISFAENLQPDDLVLTFNYDILLERALESVGKPYRLYRDRLTSVGLGSATVDATGDEVIIFKPHGSVDWFDRRSYRELQESHNKRTGEICPFHNPIFDNERIRLVPLVDGPRFPADRLREIFRVINIEDVDMQTIMFHETPVIVSPSPAKVIYAQRFGDFWYGLGNLGVLNFRVAVIGFSLSSADYYARQVLYRIVSNYQQMYWDESQLGQIKKPLRLIDFRTSPADREAYRQNYRFVDWTRAETDFDGFNEKTLTHLFR